MCLVFLAALASAAWCQSSVGGSDGRTTRDLTAVGEGDVAPLRSSVGGPAYLSVLDVAGKLLVALLVAWGLVHAARWWQQSRIQGPRPAGRDGEMWMEEVLSLGADGRLYLVEVAGRRMLLAARDGSIRRVADIGDEEEIAPAAYRSVRRRADGTIDELNVRRAPVSTRPVRPDLVRDDESWEERRGRLLRELQER